MSGRVSYAVYKTLPRDVQEAIRDGTPRRPARRSAPASAPRARERAERPAKVGARPIAERDWFTRASPYIKAATPLAMAGLKLAGFGDYAVQGVNPKENSLMSSLMVNGPPSLQSTRARSFTFRHREYLADVITGATSAFSINSYPLNPGMPDTFPWLSTIAQNFEQYRIRGMVFEFKSTSADALNSTNTALGSVIMATDYNADSDTFESKAQMENHEFASSARQSCSMLHAIECKPSQTSISELYIRNETPPTGQDLRLYDLGRFSIATVGQQGASVNIGELWVTYEVELFKPMIPEHPTGVRTDHFYSATAVSTSAYFGTSQTTINDGVGCTLSATTITFPNSVPIGSQWLVYVTWKGGAVTTVVPSISPSGATALTEWLNQTQNYITDTVASAGVTLMAAVLYEITALNAVITFSVGTLPTSITSMDLVITRVSGY